MKLLSKLQEKGIEMLQIRGYYVANKSFQAQQSNFYSIFPLLLNCEGKKSNSFVKNWENIFGFLNLVIH
jgi:hypothetical protein